MSTLRPAPPFLAPAPADGWAALLLLVVVLLLPLAAGATGVFVISRPPIAVGPALPSLSAAAAVDAVALVAMLLSSSRVCVRAR